MIGPICGEGHMKYYPIMVGVHEEARSNVPHAIWFVAALMMIVFGAGSAGAASCAHETYYYNGSELSFKECDGRPITISYENVLPALKKHGIVRGSQLFIGREQSDGTLAGTMWVYKSGCGKIGFIVRGAITLRRITLKGRVPVRDGNCDVVRTRAQSFDFKLK